MVSIEGFKSFFPYGPWLRADDSTWLEIAPAKEVSCGSASENQVSRHEPELVSTTKVPPLNPSMPNPRPLAVSSSTTMPVNHPSTPTPVQLQTNQIPLTFPSNPPLEIQTLSAALPKTVPTEVRYPPLTFNPTLSWSVTGFRPIFPLKGNSTSTFFKPYSFTIGSSRSSFITNIEDISNFPQADSTLPPSCHQNLFLTNLYTVTTNQITNSKPQTKPNLLTLANRKRPFPLSESTKHYDPLPLSSSLEPITTGGPNKNIKTEHSPPPLLQSQPVSHTSFTPLLPSPFPDLNSLSLSQGTLLQQGFRPHTLVAKKGAKMKNLARGHLVKVSTQNKATEAKPRPPHFL